jgi:hypothetical protein
MTISAFAMLLAGIFRSALAAAGHRCQMDVARHSGWNCTLLGGGSGSGSTSQIGLEKAKTVSIIRYRMKGLGVHISDAGYDFRVYRYCTSKR